MMRSFILLAGLILFTITQSIAQREANIWYFGANAGLDFNSGAPVPLTNGQVNTAEGCSAISDSAGNLLFYTDGLWVYNRNHTSMPNGFGLLGSNTSNQSALIIRQPGSFTTYYIFTVDGGNGPGGLCYSVVDMTAQGGLGDVTSKNVNLYTPTTEKLAAVKHANGVDFWILSHESTTNNFQVYLLTAAGVNNTQVISSVGTVFTNFADFNGALKVSPSHTKVGMAVWGSDYAELFDFNPGTGVLSNPITLPSITTWPYGLAFSPSGQRLYISTEGSNELSQWDLSSNNAATINASRTLIANITTMGTLGALQLAPDGKIYLAGNSTADLCVINNPDALGAACNLSINSVNLGGRFSYWGLPNFCTDYINFLTILANGNCFGDSTYFSLADTAGLISVSWNFRDSITGANNFSTSFTPAHVFSLASNFTVMVTATYTTGTFTGYLTVSIVQCSSVVAGFQADTTLCVGSCTDFTNQSVNGLTYTWSFPGAATTTSTDTDPTGICYNLAGTYDVSLIAHNGLQSDTLTLPGYIHVYAPPTAPILINQNDTLYLTQDYDSYQWYFMGAPIVGATDSFFVVTQDGLYSVQLTDANGCIFFSRTSDIAVGTSEIEGIHGGLQVFANESELIIRYQTDRTLELTFSIYDAAGRLVHTSREQSQAGANTLRLQGLQLAKGLYVLHVSDGKNILVQKFAER